MEILVAGATGYIGLQLIPELLRAGHHVRALVRDPARAKALLPEDVSVAEGDVLLPATLAPALAGIDVAYYLIHSMQVGEFSFEERDRQAARNFGQAATAAGVRRIVYLGGLGDDRTELSPHLRSRHETGAILAASGVPVTEFRAGIILGAGSASFEMLRELTERLPVMICPRWVTSPIQPIAIADVLGYLTGCLTVPETSGRVLEIGGLEVMTYQAMMQRFARLRGLHRLIVRVPVLTPRLSSYWVDIVTAVPAAVARPLIEGLKSAVVVRDPSARQLLPLPLTPFDEAVRTALSAARPGTNERALFWLRRIPARLSALAQDRLWPSVLIDRQMASGAASADAVYAEVAAIGGPNGWYFMDWAWRLRGILDRCCGGPGIDRRTPLPREIRAGDRRDFWRVLEVEPGLRLRLGALMRMPGTAELEWRIAARPTGGSDLFQTARFRPDGLLGHLYWYALLPIHGVIFKGMALAIAQRAGRRTLPGETGMGGTNA